MELEDIRKSINDIDDGMKELFYERLDCSGRVAECKLKSGGEVFRPEREREIESRLSDNERLYLPFVKKVIQISRKYQYGVITEKISADGKAKDEDFFCWLAFNSDGNIDALEDGGKLKLLLKGDPSGAKGLTVKDIISVISDTTLDIASLSCDGDMISVTFLIENNEAERHEARILAYMLYKESITA